MPILQRVIPITNYSKVDTAVMKVLVNKYTWDGTDMTLKADDSIITHEDLCTELQALVPATNHTAICEIINDWKG